MIHANYKKQETVSKLKKTYSSLVQAVRLSQIDNGFISEWYENSDKTTNSLYNTYFKPYLRNTKLVDADKVYGDKFPYKYSNGSAYTMPIVGNTVTTFLLEDGVFVYVYRGVGQIMLLIDIDAGKGQNRLGRDVFTMTIDKQKGLIPRCNAGDYVTTCTDSFLLMECSKTKAGSVGFSCMEKIVRDGWQIKENYPW